MVLRFSFGKLCHSLRKKTMYPGALVCRFFFKTACATSREEWIEVLLVRVICLKTFAFLSLVPERNSVVLNKQLLVLLLNKKQPYY